MRASYQLPPIGRGEPPVSCPDCATIRLHQGTAKTYGREESRA